jgi:hypothetical protein
MAGQQQTVGSANGVYSPGFHPGLQARGMLKLFPNLENPEAIDAKRHPDRSAAKWRDLILHFSANCACIASPLWNYFSELPRAREYICCRQINDLVCLSCLLLGYHSTGMPSAYPLYVSSLRPPAALRNTRYELRNTKNVAAYGSCSNLFLISVLFVTIISTST